jgi:uncharacterized membrane protein
MLTKIGTILYALVVAFFGINHFMNAQGMAGMIPSWLPGGVAWVYISGACLIAAAIALIINKQARLAALLLAALLIIIVLSIHLPGLMNATDEMAKIGPMTGILKDTAMAAAALVLAGKSS